MQTRRPGGAAHSHHSSRPPPAVQPPGGIRGVTDLTPGGQAIPSSPCGITWYPYRTEAWTAYLFSAAGQFELALSGRSIFLASLPFSRGDDGRRHPDPDRDPRPEEPRAAGPARGRGAPWGAGGHADRHRARGGRGRHRCRRQPADRLRRRDWRREHRPPASRRRRGGSDPAGPFRARLLPGLHLRALCGARRAAQPHHAGHARQAHLHGEQWCRGGGERGEGGARVHRPAGGCLLRARIPRPDQSDHGPDFESDAVQEGIRALRAGGVSDSVSVLLSV